MQAWTLVNFTHQRGGEAYPRDGRARTLSEAILWHGGEGESAKQAFVGMTQAEKDALLAFLKSL